MFLAEPTTCGSCFPDVCLEPLAKRRIHASQSAQAAPPVLTRDALGSVFTLRG
ncbi:hypothetical protein RISK_001763 [Rhodopirellula islandica]|uniref:Uncharacterized protein n=1 Tax=Rhodopirellula islandica TaxID=595434 RepID=A0A0J1BHA1_RHOIS|nr:hypothetical protein RISK_001763 [Rhodopirellula islandica]